MPWRDNIRLHPALDLLDPPSPAPVEALARQLAEDSSRAVVTIWEQRRAAEPFVIGGLDVLAALERNGAKVHAEVSVVDDDTCVSMWAEVWGRGGRDAIPIAIEEYRGDLGHDPHLIALSDRARSMTTAQKRDAATRIMKARSRLSDIKIAAAARLDKRTVSQIRAELTAPPSPPVEERKEPVRDRRVGAEQIAAAIRQVLRVGLRQKIATALRQAGAADIADALAGPPGTASAAGRRSRSV